MGKKLGSSWFVRFHEQTHSFGDISLPFPRSNTRGAGEGLPSPGVMQNRSETPPCTVVNVLNFSLSDEKSAKKILFGESVCRVDGFQAPSVELRSELSLGERS